MSAQTSSASLKSSTGTTTMAEKWRPEKYQLKAMSWLLSHGNAGLFLDPGLGKTSIGLGAIKTLRRTEMPAKQGFLVIAPLRPVYNVWDGGNPESEPRKWSDFHGLKTSLLHGDGKNEALRTRADLYLMNPDGLSWLLDNVKPGAASWPFYGLLVDESTDFKHSNTQRFKLLRAILPYFRRRWIFTGTPAPNGLLDLFGQIYVLDLGNALGRYITRYRLDYFLPTGYGGHTWVPQRGAEEKIYRRIEPLVLRMSERDYLKLPRLLGALSHEGTKPALVRVKLPEKARRVYDQLEELFFIELENGSVTAANSGVKSIKLRQIANGGIYVDKGGEETEGGQTAKNNRKWNLVHEAKTDAVVELLEELGKTAVIAYEFHHDLARMRLHPMLKNVPAIGEGSIKEDTQLASALNHGDIRTLFVNPASFSRGSNMQAGADALIWASMTYNYEHYDQLVRRFWRKGRVRPFFVYHIIAEETVDLAILQAIGMKNRTQRGLLDALRSYSLRRPVSKRTPQGTRKALKIHGVRSH